MIADGISLRSLRKLPVYSLWSIQLLSFSRAMMVIRRTGNLEIASNESSTNMRFASACTRDGYFSVLENPGVPVSCGAAPVVRLVTSIPWVSSSVSVDTSHFGLDVVELMRSAAQMSLNDLQFERHPRNRAASLRPASVCGAREVRLGRGAHDQNSCGNVPVANSRTPMPLSMTYLESRTIQCAE